MTKLPVALQLYTLRDEMTKDFVGTVRKVAELGYEGVEFAGYGGLSPAELKRLLDECGLRVAGSHTWIDRLNNGLEQEMEYAQAIGLKHLVVPFSPPEWRSTADDCKRFAERLNETGAKTKAAGVTLVYHNHDFEFAMFDGQYILDIFLAHSDPDLVQLELDCYWALKAGVDPEAYMRKHAGRIPLLHVKDMTAPPESTFAEVGEGVIDWNPIFAAAEVAGAQWYIVEQDRCARPPLESVAISRQNLLNWGI